MNTAKAAFWPCSSHAFVVFNCEKKKKNYADYWFVPFKPVSLMIHSTFLSSNQWNIDWWGTITQQQYKDSAPTTENGKISKMKIYYKLEMVTESDIILK